MSFKDSYALAYDVLYADKDYEAEAKYVLETLDLHLEAGKLEILEIGSGTGKHALLFEQSGHSVTCVEPSEAMANQAISKNLKVHVCGFNDIGEITDPSSFDAVLSLFHVLGYAAMGSTLDSLFQLVNQNLKMNGLFVFDVWHAPAVESIGMELRVKRVASAAGAELVRIATPNLDPESQIGVVNYEIFIKHPGDSKFDRFTERHELRFFDSDEIVDAAEKNGLEIVDSHEFMSRKSPSTSTWGVTYVARRVR